MVVQTKRIKIKLLGERLLIRVLKTEGTTQGGIVIPEASKQEKDEGYVMEAGKDVPVEIKWRDKIIFNKYAGETIRLDGEDFRIIEAKDVMAIVED